MGKIHINNFAYRLRHFVDLRQNIQQIGLPFKVLYTLTLVEALRLKILLYVKFLFTGVCYNGIYFCIPPYGFNL